MKSSVLNIVWIWLTINVLLTLSSTLIHYYRSKKIDHEGEVFQEDAQNLKLSLVNALREIFETVLGFSILAFLFYHIPGFWNLKWNLYTFLICLICVDFLYFVSHLAGHRIQFFWNYHSVHHNSEQFSLSTGFRVSWVKFVFDWIFYLPIAFVGFPPEMVLASMALVTSYTHLLHTKNIQSIPVFEYIFNTPRSHRIHHSSYEAHIDKNMGGILLIWDILFGTFSLKQQEQVVYGLTVPLEKKDLFFINFAEWKKTRMVFKTFGLKKTFLYLIKNPMNNKYIFENPKY